MTTRKSLSYYPTIPLNQSQYRQLKALIERFLRLLRTSNNPTNSQSPLLNPPFSMQRIQNIFANRFGYENFNFLQRASKANPNIADISFDDLVTKDFLWREELIQQVTELLLMSTGLTKETREFFKSRGTAENLARRSVNSLLGGIKTFDVTFTCHPNVISVFHDIAKILKHIIAPLDQARNAEHYHIRLICDIRGRLSENQSDSLIISSYALDHTKIMEETRFPKSITPFLVLLCSEGVNLYLPDGDYNLKPFLYDINQSPVILDTSKKQKHDLKSKVESARERLLKSHTVE